MAKFVREILIFDCYVNWRSTQLNASQKPLDVAHSSSERTDFIKHVPILLAALTSAVLASYSYHLLILHPIIASYPLVVKGVFKFIAKFTCHL